MNVKLWNQKQKNRTEQIDKVTRAVECQCFFLAQRFNRFKMIHEGRNLRATKCCALQTKAQEVTQKQYWQSVIKASKKISSNFSVWLVTISLLRGGVEIEGKIKGTKCHPGGWIVALLRSNASWTPISAFAHCVCPPSSERWRQYNLLLHFNTEKKRGNSSVKGEDEKKLSSPLARNFALFFLFSLIRKSKKKKPFSLSS